MSLEAVDQNSGSATTDTGSATDSGPLAGIFSPGEDTGTDGNEAESPLADILGPPDTADGPADSSTEDEAPAGDGKDTAGQETQQAQAASPDAKLQQLASEYGLDPTNPKHRQLLESMIAKSGETAQEQTGEQTGEDDDQLSEYERSLLAEEQTAQTAGEEAQGTDKPAPLAPGKFGDVLDDTENYEQAMQRYSDAWSPDEQGNIDYKKAADVTNALWMRQFAGIGTPIVRNIVNTVLRQQLGDVLDVVADQRQRQQIVSLHAEVVDGMKKQPGYEHLDELFKPQSDKKIKVRGQELPDTKINRVFSKYPWILDIHSKHPDPVKAQKATFAARLRTVAKLLKESEKSVSVADAKELVKTGAEIERKKQNDTTRQRLNAGPGATGAGAPGKSDDDDFMQRVLKPGGGRALSVADLLSSR